MKTDVFLSFAINVTPFSFQTTTSQRNPEKC